MWHIYIPLQPKASSWEASQWKHHEPAKSTRLIIIVTASTNKRISSLWQSPSKEKRTCLDVAPGESISNFGQRFWVWRKWWCGFLFKYRQNVIYKAANINLVKKILPSAWPLIYIVSFPKQKHFSLNLLMSLHSTDPSHSLNPKRFFLIQLFLKLFQNKLQNQSKAIPVGL